MVKKDKFRQGLSRRIARIAPRPHMLIVCEGKVTESTYFKDFRRWERNQLVDVVVNDEAGVPKTLVERAAELKKEAIRQARRLRDEFHKYDEVWCVFDVDSHPNLPDALQQARDNGIEIALSNPCFEVWILLHYQDQRGHLERDQAQRACRKHLPNYYKLVPFEELRAFYEDAVARATALEQWQIESGRRNGNPITRVHRLTERIRALGREPTLQRLSYVVK